MRRRTEISVRFWPKVDKDGPIPEHRPELGPCWVWTAGRFPDGYGQFAVERIPRHAHRLSWAMANGPIADGLLVLHHCDNRPCVNPGHLFLGTHKDNMRDMVAKGRAASGERHTTRLHPERVVRGLLHGRHTHPERTARGERQAQSKLTEAKVRSIRRSRAAGDPLWLIALYHGVSISSISRVCLRHTWKHITEE